MESCTLYTIRMTGHEASKELQAEPINNPENHDHFI